ncbi:MAG: AraC family transcriptional regulator [Lentisphaerae bacterium]|nr:MAG: AraC family transcriptional regulator [Lentisphaerota bacterium]
MTQNFTQYRLDFPFQDYNLRVWPRGYAMDWHSHRFVQIIHVLEGTLEVDIGDGWQGLKRWDVHILMPGTAHRLRSSEGQRQFGLNFAVGEKEHLFLRMFAEHIGKSGTYHFNAGEDWLKQLERITPAHDAFSRAWLRNLLDSYCFRLLDSLREHTVETRLVTSWRERILTLIRQDYSRQWKVDEAAQALKVSRSTLQRICRKVFQTGFRQLEEQIRLDYAAEQLVFRNITVSECAVQCGYPDIYSFSRAFKRLFGVSPNIYRQNHRQMIEQKKEGSQ